MKIDIRFVGIAADPQVRRFVERVAESAFGKLRERFATLRVCLSGVAEARDGKDRSCLVQIDLAGRQRVVAEVLDSDIRVATHRAFDRAGWQAARRLQRQRREDGRLAIAERHSAGYRSSYRVA